MVAGTTTTEIAGSGLRSSLPLVAAVVGLISCGGDNLLLPSAGQPSEISVVWGDGQTGTVGRPLDDSLVVIVTDPEKRPVEGVAVAFVPPAGAVLAPSDTVVTGGDGRAAVYYTLGTTSGDQAVEARAQPPARPTRLNTTFHALAHPDAASALVAAAGDSQTAQVTTALPDSLAVRVVDRFGNGVGGTEVTWEATGGTVSPTSVITAPDGRAAAERTLGERAGPYPTMALVGGLQGSPISFAATGITPPSPQLLLVTQPSATAPAGAEFARQPVLQLQDPVGAPLPEADVSVTVQIATGGGSLGGKTTAKSNAEGVVSFTDLSIRGDPGERTLIFAATDFSSATSDPIRVTVGPPAAGQSSASVENGTAGASTTISVRLKDQFGTPVEGKADAITISVDGANPASSLAASDRGKGSYSASYVPIHSGTDRVSIRVNGAALPGSPFASTVAAGAVDPSASTAVVTKTFIFFIFFRIDAVVTARDTYGNPVGRGGERVHVQLADGNSQDAFDNSDGTYIASLNTTNPDQLLTVTMNDVEIAGSPYTPKAP